MLAGQKMTSQAVESICSKSRREKSSNLPVHTPMPQPGKIDMTASELPRPVLHVKFERNPDASIDHCKLLGLSV